ncbi:DMT family transporter [Evansella cellulosilytica]|uniref:EamA domain-containing protein n=1 Tax=Evansella cellulosilytica (strain ATCC 21833 / DSM 2522 / FERM P-1141 / JCM 9156 / N-4) TaxID=649639 RepID=E6TY19_EVAC2|nr:EamA family transporter [Evansella cellulosilytica]ADU31232.1 protein of unknown function DUF6 transmembrane [Evansella cellulosilytica DSM 2522]
MYKMAFLMIVIGASLWGTIGLFVNGLYTFGFSPIEVVTLRVTVAFITLLVYVVIKDIHSLKIKWKHLPYFFGTGVCSIVFFNWAYFTAIQEMNLSIAAVLLYTGPAFVTIMSRIFFKELITPQKMIALVTTFIGCVLVIGLLPFNDVTMFSFYGFIIGLSSGFGYALYSIFGKIALANYSSLTTTVYTFFIATLVLIPTSGLFNHGVSFINTQTVLLSLGLGIIPTVLAYLLYTKGLQSIESSKASIATTIEPVVAALIGVFIFKDTVTYWQVVGMLCIVMAVMFMHLPWPVKLTKKAYRHVS